MKVSETYFKCMQITSTDTPENIFRERLGLHSAKHLHKLLFELPQTISVDDAMLKHDKWCDKFIRRALRLRKGAL